MSNEPPADNHNGKAGNPAGPAGNPVGPAGNPNGLAGNPNGLAGNPNGQAGRPAPGARNSDTRTGGSGANSANSDTKTGTTQRIGGFEILSKVGKGGMGTVFRARQVSMDRIVALKILPPHLARNQQFVARFLREAHSAARLNHANIVQAFDAGKADGYHYFAMEFVDGQNLSDMLKASGLLPERRALEIARDVALALDYAHSCEIIHRDVKPDNILLAADGSAKLADLGLARETTHTDNNLTQTGTAIGTPNYISPEQVRGETDLDGRCDIYALGATLYHLLVGFPPYKGGTSTEVMAKHLSAPVPDPRQVNPKVSYEASRIVRRALAKERDRRYPTAKEFLNDVERLLAAPEDHAGEAEEPAAVAADAPPAGRLVRRGFYIAAAITGVIAVVALAMAVHLKYTQPRLWFGSRTPEEPEVVNPPPMKAAPAPQTTEPGRAALEEERMAKERKERQERLDRRERLRTEMAALVDKSEFREALRLLAGHEQKYPADLTPDAVDRSRRMVFFRAEQRYGELVREVDAAIAAKDYAKARGVLAAVESFGIPHLSQRAQQRLAEVNAREKHAQLWSQWEGVKAQAKDLAKGGKFDDAVRALNEAKSMSIDGIAGLVRQEVESVEAARREAADAAVEAYQKESDAVWMLFKERKYAEGDARLAPLAADPRYKPAAQCIQADTAAAARLKEFWAAAEKGIAMKKGAYIAFAGARGDIVSVENGEVVMKEGETAHKRRVTELYARQALVFWKLGDNAEPRLTLGIFLLAEAADLEDAQKAFEDAGSAPEVQFYKDRLSVLMVGASETAAKRAWERIQELSGKAGLTRDEMKELLRLLREYDDKYARTKFGATVKEKIAKIRAGLIPVYDKWPFDEREAKRRQQDTAEILGCPVEKSADLGGGVKLDLVLIPAGEFVTGSAERGLFRRPDADRQVQVRITRPFYIGKHEVTQEQWEKLLPGGNPSAFVGARNPVDQVSWTDCQLFIGKLNALGKERFRLPAEAEWEYACRAGTSTAYSFGERITADQANFNSQFMGGGEGGFRGKTAPVASFPANAFGLHDMHGNVTEWCQDWYGPYPNEPQTDPQGPDEGADRVMRGGSWNTIQLLLLSSSRLRLHPSLRIRGTTGFRVVMQCPGMPDAPRPKPAAGEAGGVQRQTLSSRPGLPDLEWRAGSRVIKGVSAQGTEWQVTLPFAAGQVREQDGLWIVVSDDQTKEAAIGPRDGRVIRVIQKMERPPDQRTDALEF